MTTSPHRSLVAAGVVFALLAGSAHAQDIDDILDDLEADVEEPAASRAVRDDIGLDGVGPDDEGLGDLLGDVPESAATTSTGRTWIRGITGFVQIEGKRYARERRRGRDDEQLLISAEVEIDLRLGNGLTGYVRPRLLVEALHGELERFEPYEAYVTFEGDGVELRVGQFVENWGIVDTYNPIDVINRRDLGSDFLDPDRLGEAGVRIRKQWAGGETFAEPTLSLYALPAFRRTEFPEDDGRFSFGTATQPFRAAGGFEPSGSEGHFWGARFQTVLNTAAINSDTQLVVSHGPERTPTFAPRRREVAPVYYGVTNIGAGIRGVPNEDVLGEFLSKLTLKAEVVYKDAYSFSNAPVPTPDDYLAYVGGVDRAFDRVFSDLDQLTAMVEVAGETGADDAASQFRPFKNDVVLRLFWEGNDFARSSVELRALVDLDEDERIYELIAERTLRSIDEDLTAFVSAQVFHQPDNGRTLFDLFPNNTSVSIGLRWDF